jgi:hypothetical protein
MIDKGLITSAQQGEQAYSALLFCEKARLLLQLDAANYDAAAAALQSALEVAQSQKVPLFLQQAEDILQVITKRTR